MALDLIILFPISFHFIEKSFKMNKKVISIFSFGFLLIVIGSIGKILKWDQASVILATGLVFEAFAILIFAWNKIKKNE